MIQLTPALTIQPPTGGHRQDVSQLWWPGYNRESLAIGGDFRANTSFEVPLIEADKWKEVLGWHFEERWGGMDAFSARLHSVLVDVAGAVSVASLDKVWNAVRVKYTELSTDESEELVVNGSFETLDATGTYTFEGWGEIGSDGAVVQSGFHKYGSYCCRITAGASTNKQVGNTFRVRAGKTYELRFWTRGDGAYAGRYEVFNNDTAGNIVSLTSTGITGTTFTEIVTTFTIPDGCSSISVRLRCPATNGGITFFDDVSLKAYENTAFTSSWYTDDESIARFGRREKELAPRVVTDSSGAAYLAQRYLARHAWPEDDPQRLTDDNTPTTATVTIAMQGHIQGLNHQHHDDTSTTLVDADDAITTALSAATTIITAGDIRANSAVQISEESDGEVIWQRLKEIAEFGDDSQQYLIGCYAGTRLDYKPIDPNTISYTSEMGSDGKLRFFDAANREIPGAIMRPGLIVWRRDLRPGVPRRTPFTDDTRATLIGSISIRRGEVSIQAFELNETAFLHGLINSIKKGA